MRECGGKYHPTKFHDMLESLGGLATAHALLRPDADFFSYGFGRLCELNRVHLTMERMIVDLEYAEQIFSPAEIKNARDRLDAGKEMAAKFNSAT